MVEVKIVFWQYLRSRLVGKWMNAVAWVAGGLAALKRRVFPQQLEFVERLRAMIWATAGLEGRLQTDGGSWGSAAAPTE